MYTLLISGKNTSKEKDFQKLNLYGTTYVKNT